MGGAERAAAVRIFREEWPIKKKLSFNIDLVSGAAMLRAL
jgi:hypothetical protein